MWKKIFQQKVKNTQDNDYLFILYFLIVRGKVLRKGSKLEI